MNGILSFIRVEKNKRTIIFFAAALIFAGVFVPYLGISFSEVIFSIKVAVSDAPIYLLLFFLLAVAAMVFAVLRENALVGIIGSGAGLAGNIFIGYVCKHPVLIINMCMNYVASHSTLFGSEEIADTAKEIAEEILDEGSDAVAAELSQYLNLSLSFGFYFILIGSLAGCLMFAFELANRGKVRPYSRPVPAPAPIPITVSESQGLLRCVKGECYGASIIMNSGDTILLGRDPAASNLILKEDRKISRRHCAVSFRNGEFYVTDYSSNGTALGSGRGLEKNREVYIGHNEDIYLSQDTVFRVQIKPN